MGNVKGIQEVYSTVWFIHKSWYLRDKHTQEECDALINGLGSIITKYRGTQYEHVAKGLCDIVLDDCRTVYNKEVTERKRSENDI